MTKKEKAMRYYFKKYLLGCDYTTFIEWLDPYFKRHELDCFSTYLFRKGMDLWYTEEDDDEIIEKAINDIKKYWYIIHVY